MRGGTNTASAKGAPTEVLVVESPRCSWSSRTALPSFTVFHQRTYAASP